MQISSSPPDKALYFTVCLSSNPEHCDLAEVLFAHSLVFQRRRGECRWRRLQCGLQRREAKAIVSLWCDEHINSGCIITLTARNKKCPTLIKVTSKPCLTVSLTFLLIRLVVSQWPHWLVVFPEAPPSAPLGPLIYMESTYLCRCISVWKGHLSLLTECLLQRHFFLISLARVVPDALRFSIKWTLTCGCDKKCKQRL